jgi:pimeloyl-ACP methyl ester carboxylesterase
VPRVGGVEIAVVDEGSGPAFFWGHGFSSSTAQESAGLVDWSRLAARHRIVRWDAPGHGGSGGGDDPGRYRWEMLGRGLGPLADALGIDTFAAGGVSMGAAGALWAAVAYPERVTGLVLGLPPTAYETRAPQADRYAAGAELAEREGVDAYMAVARDEPVAEILRDLVGSWDVTPQIRADLLPAVLRGAATSDLPPLDAVCSVGVPVLILAWVGDPGHPLSTAELLAETLPHAALQVAQNLTDVLGWTDCVEAFLDRVALS